MAVEMTAVIRKTEQNEECSLNARDIPDPHQRLDQAGGDQQLAQNARSEEREDHHDERAVPHSGDHGFAGGGPIFREHDDQPDDDDQGPEVSLNGDHPGQGHRHHRDSEEEEREEGSGQSAEKLQARLRVAPSGLSRRDVPHRVSHNRDSVTIRLGKGRDR